VEILNLQLRYKFGRTVARTSNRKTASCRIP